MQADTTHGVLGYKRKGADEKVQWAPPSALRRIDVILVDEASQYDNLEWKRCARAVWIDVHKVKWGGEQQQCTEVSTRNAQRSPRPKGIPC